MVTLTLDSVSFTRGSQSMTITSSAGTTVPTASFVYPSTNMSLHFNWMTLDGFETYTSSAHLNTAWIAGAKGMYRTLSPVVNVTNYNILSFNAIANTGSGVRIAFSFYAQNPTAVTHKITSEPLANYWKRYEIYLPWYLNESYYASFNKSEIVKVSASFEGNVNVQNFNVTIDDVLLYDARSLSENGTWAPLMPSKLSTQYPAQVAKSGIAGVYGESINVTTPGNIEGSFVVRTEPRRFEEEVALLERIKRSGRQILLKMGSETFPVNLTSVDTTAEDTSAGMRKICRVEFFEERF